MAGLTGVDRDGSRDTREDPDVGSDTEKSRGSAGPRSATGPTARDWLQKPQIRKDSGSFQQLPRHVRSQNRMELATQLPGQLPLVRGAMIARNFAIENFVSGAG